MNNYVTTKIRILESDYLRLKDEAARKRTSLCALIREKIGVKNTSEKSPDKILQLIRTHAHQNEQNLDEVDIVERLREMRYQRKW
jgi:hypothetical protein